MNVRTATALALIGMGFLAGCTDASPYQSKIVGYFGSPGGYDETETGHGHWHVAFSGTAYTTQDTLQTYWLYRCAELAIKNGYDGFEVLSHVRFTEDAKPPQQPIQPGDRIDGTVFHFGAEIRLLKRPFDGVPPQVFDASALLIELKPSVMGPKCEHQNVCPHNHDYLRPTG